MNLLDQDGLYAELWRRQAEAQLADEIAQAAE